jgi:hypothetical protein
MLLPTINYKGHMLTMDALLAAADDAEISLDPSVIYFK